MIDNDRPSARGTDPGRIAPSEKVATMPTDPSAKSAKGVGDPRWRRRRARYAATSSWPRSACS